MEESNKLPLKRVELSLSKFNEVAIPHHLDLLRQHKANIIKHEQCGRAGRVRAEQAHARRVAAQLRALLEQVGALRGRVCERDRAAFDARTQRSRDLTLAAIEDYLDTSPLPMSRAPLAEAAAGAAGAGSCTSTDSVGLVAHGPPEDEPLEPLLQLQVDDHEVALREREEVLRGWGELQGEVHALHDAWRHVQDAARAQHDQVEAAAAHAHRAAGHVGAARASLSAAERLKAGGLCVGGAMVGAMAGGPVGLAVGAKAGAAAALAGSLLGYLGGRLLGRLPPALPRDKTL